MFGIKYKNNDIELVDILKVINILFELDQKVRIVLQFLH